MTVEEIQYTNTVIFNFTNLGTLVMNDVSFLGILIEVSFCEAKLEREEEKRKIEEAKTEFEKKKKKMLDEKNALLKEIGEVSLKREKTRICNKKN